LARLEQALLPDAGPLPSLDVWRQVIRHLTDEHLELLVTGLKGKRAGRTPTEQERAAQRGLDLLVQRESRARSPFRWRSS